MTEISYVIDRHQFPHKIGGWLQCAIKSLSAQITYCSGCSFAYFFKEDTWVLITIHWSSFQVKLPEKDFMIPAPVNLPSFVTSILKLKFLLSFLGKFFILGSGSHFFQKCLCCWKIPTWIWNCPVINPGLDSSQSHLPHPPHLHITTPGPALTWTSLPFILETISGSFWIPCRFPSISQFLFPSSTRKRYFWIFIYGLYPAYASRCVKDTTTKIGFL